MVDLLSREERSKRMALVRTRDTKPELTLRRILHHSGLRYRVNLKGLPGSPDIVFQRKRIAIFVHGCFWHRHARCPATTTPKTNTAYWQNKFSENRVRDRKVRRYLRRLGWDVIVVWECQLKSRSKLERLSNALLFQLRSMR
jgi:DNA mismatch endonuclease, patch repair protein